MIVSVYMYVCEGEREKRGWWKENKHLIIQDVKLLL